MTKAFATVVGVLLTACSLYGDTIFNDFPDTTINITVLASQSNGGFPAWASEFTASQTYDLTSVEVALGYISGTNAATVELVSDNSGTPGNTVLESWSLTNVADAPSGNGDGIQPTETLDDQTGLVLDADTNYWLEVVAGDSTTEMALQDTDPPNPPSAFDRLQDGSWVGPVAVSMTFDAEGTPASTPEPATFLLAGGALVGLGLIRRRRSH